MELEVGVEPKDKRLNRMVALTVVTLSVFMGVAQVKDGNIVQAMQQAQSDAVDRWDEYQATKTKMHIDETALAQTRFVAAQAGGMVADVADREEARLSAEVSKYQAEIPKLRSQAEGLEQQYDALNVHDDQFDASDALIGIAVSIAAVSALAESFPALVVAWVFGVLGVVMGLAGFLGWSLHSATLARLLS